MEGVFPMSKSSYGLSQLCLWFLYARKILKLDTGDRRSASVGKAVHKWRAKILSGATDLGSALDQISDPEVTDLLCGAIAKSVYTDILDQKLEQHYQNELVHGYIDRLGRINNSRLFVEDLNTGRWELDDENERDTYSVLAWENLATPEDKDLLFVNFSCRTGNHLEFLYTAEGIEEAKGRIAERVEWLRAADPVPNPGAHCLRWFGPKPCPFHGKDCPLAKDVPALIDAAVPIEMAAIGQAFMAIYRGFRGEIGPNVASLALQGVHQIEAAAKIVEEALKQWADEKGPIEMGEDRFGWYPVSDYEVNKPFALSALLLSEMTTAEIAKVVSISKTAIDKLISKRKYPDLRQSILDLAVSKSDGTKRRFGRIKD
jgi:hypothetical protein